MNDSFRFKTDSISLIRDILQAYPPIEAVNHRELSLMLARMFDGVLYSSDRILIFKKPYEVISITDGLFTTWSLKGGDNLISIKICEKKGVRAFSFEVTVYDHYELAPDNAVNMIHVFNAAVKSLTTSLFKERLRK